MMTGTAIMTLRNTNLFAAIEGAPLADSTKAQYTKALARYLETGASLTDADALASYAQTLKQSARAFLKAA